MPSSPTPPGRTLEAGRMKPCISLCGYASRAPQTLTAAQIRAAVRDI
jgi:hypothetical protein